MILELWEAEVGGCWVWAQKGYTMKLVSEWIACWDKSCLRNKNEIGKYKMILRLQRYENKYEKWYFKVGETTSVVPEEFWFQILRDTNEGKP